MSSRWTRRRSPGCPRRVGRCLLSLSCAVGTFVGLRAGTVMWWMLCRAMPSHGRSPAVLLLSLCCAPLLPPQVPWRGVRLHASWWRLLPLGSRASEWPLLLCSVGTFRGGCSLDSKAPSVWRRLWQLRSSASEWTGVACGVIFLLTAAVCPGLRQSGPALRPVVHGCALPHSPPAPCQ